MNAYFGGGSNWLRPRPPSVTPLKMANEMARPRLTRQNSENFDEVGGSASIFVVTPYK